MRLSRLGSMQRWWDRACSQSPSRDDYLCMDRHKGQGGMQNRVQSAQALGRADQRITRSEDQEIRGSEDQDVAGDSRQAVGAEQWARSSGPARRPRAQVCFA